MIPFSVKELSALIDCRCHNRIVVLGKWNVGAVRLEEVLVNMEAWAKCFQRGLQPLHRVLLLGAVKTLVVHASNSEHHAHVTALGEKGRRIPETVQIDVVIQCSAVFPRLNDLIETQHQTTSTRGTCCLAAS